MSIQRFKNRHAAGSHYLFKRIGSRRERILLVLRFRNKVCPSGKHFSDRADHTGNMLDTVNDHIFVIDKDDITVFTHDLNDQLLTAKITHFVQMLYMEVDDSLQPRLGDVGNPAVLQMLSQQHTKTRCRHGTGLVIFC